MCYRIIARGGKGDWYSDVFIQYRELRRSALCVTLHRVTEELDADELRSNKVFPLSIDGDNQDPNLSRNLNVKCINAANHPHRFRLLQINLKNNYIKIILFGDGGVFTYGWCDSTDAVWSWYVSCDCGCLSGSRGLCSSCLCGHLMMALS